MRYAWLGTICALLAPLALATTTQPARALAVDVELMLLIDVSRSIDDDIEYPLQMQGYRDAFNDPGVLAAIESGELGRIAVRADFWSSADQFEQAVDWMVISDAAGARAFADAIGDAGRPFRGLTAPGQAIVQGMFNFDNAFEGARQVMDISGDGAQNDGLHADTAVAFALAYGVDTINALAIEGDKPASIDGSSDYPGQTIAQWYAAHLRAGDDSFVMQVSSFEDFGAAITEKIEREIAVVPLPGAFWLFGAGFLAILRLARRAR